MTQYLPPNLLALFAPREPIPYFPPLDTLPWDKKPWPYAGIAEYVQLFEDPSETPAPTRGETKEERIARKQQERKERESETLKDQVDNWDLDSDPNVDGDPFKTLFVGRINFDTSESKLRREFEQYGRVKKIKMIMNSVTGKPRGYAFIEYEKERDMHTAYKHADGKKIDGKRVVVDVERGRTVKSWKPRRLGGGLGGTRRGGPNDNIKYSGRVDDRDVSGGGEDRERRDGDRERRDGDRERRDGDRERRRSHSRGRQRRRSRSRERSRRDRSRSRSRDRSDRRRDSERRDRERSSRRDRDKDRGDRDRDRGKDRHRDRGDKNRDKERDRKRDRDSRDDTTEDRNNDKRIKVESESRDNGTSTGRGNEVIET